MTRFTGDFRVLAGSACASLLLAVMTLVWREWIEIVFRFDPDRGSGSAEWLIVGLASAASIVLAARARSAWQQRAAAAA